MKKMKDSGVAWIGEIPSNWALVRVKNQYSSHKTIAGSDSEKYERLALTLNGVIKRSKEDSNGLQPEAFDGYQVLNTGELVFKLIDLANVATSRIGYSPYTGIVSPAYIILSPNKDAVAKFGEKFFLSMWQREVFNHMGDDGVRSSLNVSDLLDIPYPHPPLPEQQRIADFLDRKCADIDNVLLMTKTSIEEYKKLKQSVITEAVTKGIRGERPMKDSGSAWFGNIPETWDANKLKYTFTIRKRIVGEDGHTVLAITQKGVKPKDMSNGNGQFAESYANYQIVNPGDFAMNHMDLLTGWVDISKYEGVTSPDYRVFTLDDTTRNCPGYYLYMMQMCYSNRIFYSMGQGVSGMGRWRLPADMFNNFIIACPPFEEQQEIAEYLDKKCSEIDSLIASKEKFITELESYKKSLIYEYVTGKKEVPAEA